MRQRDDVLPLIGAFKLAKALALLAAGVGLVSLGDGHEPTVFAHLAADPQNEHINALMAKLAATSPHELRDLGIGSFIYAALFATEGTGLLLRALWAEYLTIIITGSFIPLEVYEMVHHRSIVKGIVLALNVAIVVYLVVDTVHGHRRRRRHA